MGKSEIFFLDSMLMGRPDNLAYCIVRQMFRVKRCQKLLFGPIVTRLAHRAMRFSSHNLISRHLPFSITFNFFDEMGFFNVFDDFVFSEPGFTEKEERALSHKHRSSYRFIDLYSAKAKEILDKAKKKVARPQLKLTTPPAPAAKSGRKKNRVIKAQASIAPTPVEDAPGSTLTKAFVVDPPSTDGSISAVNSPAHEEEIDNAAIIIIAREAVAAAAEIDEQREEASTSEPPIKHIPEVEMDHSESSAAVLNEQPQVRENEELEHPPLPLQSSHNGPLRLSIQ